MAKQRSADDWLRDAEESPRAPRKDNGRGRRPADKGRAAAAQLGNDNTPRRKLLERDPRKTGIRRGDGIVDRAHDPMFRDAIAAIDAMNRRGR